MELHWGMEPDVHTTYGKSAMCKRSLYIELTLVSDFITDMQNHWASPFLPSIIACWRLGEHSLGFVFCLMECWQQLIAATSCYRQGSPCPPASVRIVTSNGTLPRHSHPSTYAALGH
ncbi:hypothetical protein KIL84_015994 [Mauremys mutica]|uniref:Uncharacterized protein n=1 Tax=Mauremys mutica TaxID=74926 RepID=A0A9D3WRM7_9SAUR|nr:hypothetical protein KIL84_015994 [Mauremys mutica]